MRCECPLAPLLPARLVRFFSTDVQGVLDIRTLHQGLFSRLSEEQRRGKRDSWGALIAADQEASASGGDSTAATSGANREDNSVGDGSSTDDTAIAGECGADTTIATATSSAASANAATPGGDNDATDAFFVSGGDSVSGCSAAAAADVDDDDDDEDGDSDSDDGDGWEDVERDGGQEGSDDTPWEKVGVEDDPSPTFEYDEATMGGMRPPPFALPRVVVGKDQVQVSWLRGRQRRPLSVSVHRSFEREMPPPRARWAGICFDHAKGAADLIRTTVPSGGAFSCGCPSAYIQFAGQSLSGCRYAFFLSQRTSFKLE